ncbi:hypothetical protein SLA2020_363290 [Shorea laevis]
MFTKSSGYTDDSMNEMRGFSEANNRDRRWVFSKISALRVFLRQRSYVNIGDWIEVQKGNWIFRKELANQRTQAKKKVVTSEICRLGSEKTERRQE